MFLPKIDLEKFPALVKMGEDIGEMISESAELQNEISELLKQYPAMSAMMPKEMKNVLKKYGVPL